MRILIHDYAGHSFAITLSRELASRGAEVTHAFASRLQTPRGELARKPGDPATLEFASIPMDPRYVREKYSFIRRRNYEVEYGRRVGEYIAETNPDVVLSGNTPSEAQEYIIRGCRRSGAAFVYWMQDSYGIAVSRLIQQKLPVVGWPVGSYYRWLDRRHLTMSDGIVLITEAFLPQLCEWGIDRGRSHVIENWADISSVSEVTKGGAWAVEQGLQDKFVFLYSGTLGMKHNPGLLLSLAEAFRDDPDVRIVVNSEGLGAEFLRREKAYRNLDNLVLNGYQPSARMNEVLGAADVFISVLKSDASAISVPSKTLIYLCGGRPVLAAMPRENLAAQMIETAGAGHVVAPLDTRGLVNAAKHLRSDTTARLRMGRRARAYAEQAFDISRIADRFQEVFALAMTRASGVRPDWTTETVPAVDDAEARELDATGANS